MHLTLVACFCLILGTIEKASTLSPPNIISPQFLSNSKSYTVSVNTKLNITANNVVVNNVKSTIGCASLCTMDSRCCAGSFDKIAGKCLLYFICCNEVKQSQPDSGFNTIFRQPQAQWLRSCSDLGIGSPSGVYKLYPDCENGVEVFCEMSSDTRGWTAIQKRFNGQTDFYRDWNEYKTGFGDPNNEFWIGNDNLNTITSLTPHKLRVELRSYDNETAFAEYSSFHVDNEANNYTLTVAGYSGNAGNSMVDGQTRSTLSGWGFSTKDRRHDDRPSDWIPCAEHKMSGWWHRRCAFSNVNGLYSPESLMGQTMHWRTFKGMEALEKCTMLIKPT